MRFATRSLDDTGFGAIVHGDLTSVHAEPNDRTLLQALHRHRVLICPRQHLNHADLLAVARTFGVVDTAVDQRHAVAGFPGLTTISNIVEGGRHIGIYDGDNEDEWHADNSFKARLTSATLLYSVITPAHGGNTRFADTTRAYADLTNIVKERISGLRAVHSIEHLATLQRAANNGQSSAAAGTLAAAGEVEHPIVIEHPATGLRSLLLGSMVIHRVTGLSTQESTNLLADLLTHATSPPYVYSHRWAPGDLVIWDNRAVLHTASPCDSSRHYRLLYRAAIR